MTIIKDDKMGGQPRLVGRRITVYHVITAIQDFGGIDDAADQLRIPAEEVREAYEYASENPDEIEPDQNESDGMPPIEEFLEENQGADEL